MIEIDLTKIERGLRPGKVRVTRGGKTFWREQRVGQKETEKEPEKGSKKAIYPIRQPEKNITQVIAGETYTGKLYHSTSLKNAEKISEDGFHTKGKLADRYTPEQRKGAQTWSKYGFIYFNNDIKSTKDYGDATFEIDVKDLRVAGGTEFTDVLVRYQDEWAEKIESAIDKHGFSSPEVKNLYAEREGKKNTVMTDLVIKDFNKKFDGMIGLPGDIVITNSNIIKNIERVR